MIIKKLNILHLTPDFNYSDGRSYYVYLVLKYLKRSGHNVFLCTNSGDSFDRLKDLEIPIFVNPSLSKKTSFPESVIFIKEIVRTNKIDIIHSHHRYYELLANSISKKKKIRTVFTSLSIVDRRYFVEYRSDRIIAVSNCVRNMLTSRFRVNEKKICLIPNFVDSEEIIRQMSNVRRQTSDGRRQTADGRGQMLDVKSYSEIGNRNSRLGNKKRTNILSIGRFHKEKDFETLLKAISLIKDQHIKLILIGEGGEKENYLNIINKNSLDVDFILPQRDLDQFFKIADICILSSVRDPLPSFMLQSGLFNKPFIGTNADGIPEVIENEVNGLLFEKKNAAQLSEKIKLFIDEPAFAKEMFG